MDKYNYSNLQKLNKDALFSIALELDFASLLNFCSSSKKINNLICKRDDIWRTKLRKEYPVIDVAMLKNPRETYRKIIDAKTNPQKKFNKYLWDRDYEMRDILPKIYHVIWPYVGSVYRDKFIVNRTLNVESKILLRLLDFYSGDLRDMFHNSFKIGMIIEDIPSLKKYRDDIIRLRELYSMYFIYRRPDIFIINSIVNKLEKSIPRLRQILTNEIREYLLKNNQVYKVGIPIASLYLV